MMVLDVSLGHVGGFPVEELAPFACGAGLLAARELWMRLRERMQR
jgi:hypothetical protein